MAPVHVVGYQCAGFLRYRIAPQFVLRSMYEPRLYVFGTEESLDYAQSTIYTVQVSRVVL